MMVIVGSILLVGGLSEYLPAARHARRFSRERFRRLELIKKIDQLVAVESRQPDLFAQALQHIMEQYGFTAGAAFRYAGDGTLACLRAEGLYTDAAISGETVSFKSDALTGVDHGDVDRPAVSSWPDDSPAPDLVLPVRNDGQVEAVFAFAAKPQVLDEDDILNLKIALDSLARKVRAERQDARRLRTAGERKWVQQLSQDMDYKAGLRANLSKLAEVFSREVEGATLICLSHRSDRRIDRYTVGANGAFLREPGLSADRICNAFVEVCCGKAARLVRLEEDSSSELTRLGLRRAAAAPVRPGTECSGALIIAWSDKIEAPSGNVLDRLMQSAPLLDPLLALEQVRRDNSRFEKQRSELIGFLQRVAKEGDLAECLQGAAELLAAELGSSVVRISTYEADGQHLRSRGLAVSRACALTGEVDAVMDLDSTPYHRLVRDTRRLMLINQQDTRRRIEATEARLIGTEELRSALLVPVVVNDMVLAVISIADLREWSKDRWDHGSIQFANTVAHVLSLAVRMSLRRTGRARDTREHTVPNRLETASASQPV
jgi:hypothetical protein